MPASMGCGLCHQSKSVVATTPSQSKTLLPTQVESTKANHSFRSFSPATAKGGAELVASKIAVLFIEYQNEFASTGGKLHDAVKEVMDASDMLNKSMMVAKCARATGCKVFHAPISFAADGSDNPNKGLGILAGCHKDGLFAVGTWNSEICDAMKPESSDVVVVGKKGLDAFPNTDLEDQLVAHGIETIVLGGFLTNCCVESTMRTACEKGFNVITLTDCTATTSMQGQVAAVEGTFGMFSAPMTSADLIEKLQASTATQATADRVQSPISSALAPITSNTRTFSAGNAKGGAEMSLGKIAFLFIEYQNEFTSDGGKLHGAVKEVMDATDMLKKSTNVAQEARAAGCKVFHAPISFAADGSDNPNKGLGILAGCCKDGLFTMGTWNAQICDAMKPESSDVVVVGKKGLDAFPNTDLEAQLLAHGIETIVLAGFLTNCCVESTMRTACEKGFNVITLTDCTATTSMQGQVAASEGTFGMFSAPMTSADLVGKFQALTATPAPVDHVRTPDAGAPAPIRSIARTFSAANAKGGAKMLPQKTVVLFIEYQNEFTSDGGKLHGAVKEVMDATDMLKKSSNVAKEARAAGCKVFHAPISFAANGSDNPNKGLGILAGCCKDSLFTMDTWNAQICEAMKPESSDVVVVGKKGLDAFPDTDLEAQLLAHGIETIALAGFLTNCCVESTMRTACEKGFNVITLTDCTATTSMKGQAAAIEGTYGMFSTPLAAAEFIAKLKE